MSPNRISFRTVNGAALLVVLALCRGVALEAGEAPKNDGATDVAPVALLSVACYLTTKKSLSATVFDQKKRESEFPGIHAAHFVSALAPETALPCAESFHF